MAAELEDFETAQLKNLSVQRTLRPYQPAATFPSRFLLMLQYVWIWVPDLRR